MKLLVNKTNNYIFWATDNNETSVVFVDDLFKVNDVVVSTGFNKEDYFFIEEDNQNLPEDFFLGQMLYVDGIFSFTQNYLAWNTNIHSCIESIKFEYLAKSENTEFSEEERTSFLNYSEELGVIQNTQYLNPTWQFPTPPDEIYPYTPSCLSGYTL